MVAQPPSSPKNYFMTNNGLLRLYDRDNDPKWEERKVAYNKMINGILKEKTIIEIQRLGMSHTRGENGVYVLNFN